MGFDYINKWKKQRRKRKTDLKMLQHGLMNRTKHYGSDIFKSLILKKQLNLSSMGCICQKAQYQRSADCSEDQPYVAVSHKR